jgi:hypothetical protein
MPHAAMEKERGLRLLALGQSEICRLEFSDGKPLETVRSCSAKEQPLRRMAGSQTVVFVLVLRVSTANITPRWRRYQRHIRAYNTRGDHGTGQISRWSRLHTSSSRILWSYRWYKYRRVCPSAKKLLLERIWRKLTHCIQAHCYPPRSTWPSRLESNWMLSSSVDLAFPSRKQLNATEN